MVATATSIFKVRATADFLAPKDSFSGGSSGQATTTTTSEEKLLLTTTLADETLLSFRKSQAFYVLSADNPRGLYFVSTQYATPFSRTAVSGLVPASHFEIVDLLSKDPSPNANNAAAAAVAAANQQKNQAVHSKAQAHAQAHAQSQAQQAKAQASSTSGLLNRLSRKSSHDGPIDPPSSKSTSQKIIAAMTGSGRSSVTSNNNTTTTTTTTSRNWFTHLQNNNAASAASRRYSDGALHVPPHLSSSTSQLPADHSDRLGNQRSGTVPRSVYRAVPSQPTQHQPPPNAVTHSRSKSNSSLNSYALGQAQAPPGAPLRRPSLQQYQQPIPHSHHFAAPVQSSINKPSSSITVISTRLPTSTTPLEYTLRFSKPGQQSYALTRTFPQFQTLHNSLPIAFQNRTRLPLPLAFPPTSQRVTNQQAELTHYLSAILEQIPAHILATPPISFFFTPQPYQYAPVNKPLPDNQTVSVAPTPAQPAEREAQPKSSSPMLISANALRRDSGFSAENDGSSPSSSSASPAAMRAPPRSTSRIRPSVGVMPGGAEEEDWRMGVVEAYGC
ncbi:hypothetical protein DFS34DRAFT_629284 [Phlyctochytrium arcticum]|nr:hypothetical protein DFS34DRAFT_629284 [Phlyctochytrium arcticum]